MRIRLDDEDLLLDDAVIQAGKEAVFEAAKRAAVSRNRVVTDISVDGESVDQNAFFLLSGGVDIRFATQSIRDLVNDSLQEGGKYFPLLKEGIARIATAFEEGRDQDGLKELPQALEGVNWLIDVFNRSCILMGVTDDSLKTGDFEADFAAIRNGLDAMASAMEDGKMMSLAYHIREQLIPAIDRFSLYWAEVTSQLDSPLQ